MKQEQILKNANIIGNGKFCSVYEVSKAAALKCVNIDALNNDELLFFLKDITWNNLLYSSHIIKYSSAQTVKNELYVYMPKTKYGSCIDLMKSRNIVLNENMVYLILRPVLLALGYLHSHHIIHRSVQGSNILIDGGGKVLLTGLKYCAHLGNTRVSYSLPPHVEDRLPWAAPEILKQGTEGYTYKVDLYSVGITILELLAGYPPFQGFPHTKIYLLKLSEQSMLPFNEGVGPAAISRRLTRVIDKCVQYYPQDRVPASTLLKSSFFAKMKSRDVDLEKELTCSGYSNYIEISSPVDNDTHHLSPLPPSTTTQWIF